MALTFCPECSGEVSDAAEACTHCGFPVASFYQPSAGRGTSGSTWYIVGAGLLGLALGAVLVALFLGGQQEPQVAEGDLSLPRLEQAAQSPETTIPPQQVGGAGHEDPDVADSIGGPKVIFEAVRREDLNEAERDLTQELGVSSPLPQQAKVDAETPGDVAAEVITAQSCDRVDEGPDLLDDCITGELACGEFVVGHTIGGVERYDSRFYERNFCAPLTGQQFDGGNERVYRFDAPGNRTRAVVTLETPCADLSLAAMQFPGDTCPGEGDRIPRCEKDRKEDRRTGRDERNHRQVILDQIDPTRWYLVVEGATHEEGLYALRVRCSTF